MLDMNNLETPQPFSKEGKAFYNKRYFLFSKFDKGIRIDEESWSSITPEEIAKHISRRPMNLFGEKKGVVIDPFCGVGGNTIQFAKKVGQVIAMDIDETKVHACEHNASIYQCQDSIKFVTTDWMTVRPQNLEIDSSEGVAVFLGPPWGGGSYGAIEKYSIDYVYPSFREIVK